MPWKSFIVITERYQVFIMGLETQWGDKTIPILVKCISHSTLTKSPCGNSVWLSDYDLSQASPLTTPYNPAPPFPSAAEMFCCIFQLIDGVCVIVFTTSAFVLHQDPGILGFPLPIPGQKGIPRMKAARLCFVATYSGGGVGQSLSPYKDLESVF